MNIYSAPWELDPQPSFVMVMSSLVFIIHWYHLVFSCGCLGRDFFSDHLNNLLTDDLIVKVKTFKACNKLTRVHYIMSRDLLRLFLTVMLEKILKFFNLFK
jgi:hypothetical protein